MAKKVIVVKVGSQTIIQENGDLHIAQLENLIHQIIELEKRNWRVILVSSGAVAAGRGITKHSQLSFKDKIKERQVLASLGQSKLIQIYNDILKQHHYAAAQILITKEDFRSRTHYLNIHRLMQGLLESNHLLPIVNENDTTSIEELMFTDNDELSSLVASLVDANKLVILTSVDGIYDKSPLHLDAKLIHQLQVNNEADWPSLTAEKTIYGRGGILSKIASAKRAAKIGIRTHIANANTPDILLRLIQQEEKNLGTTIIGETKVRGIKKWLAYTKHANASILVNACMANIFDNKSKAVSLLPIGIEKIEGSFKKGDIVLIKDQTSKLLGVGLAEYGSEVLEQKLGKKNEKHFMHYNKIYIFGV